MFYLVNILLTMLLSMATANATANITVLQEIDLSTNATFLVFLTYEKPNFKCPACAYFQEKLNELNIEVKTLNLFENIQLGTRFLKYAFPSFIIRSNGKSYVLEPENTEQLQNIVNSENWKNINPVRNVLDVNSIFVKTFSRINPMFFAIIKWLNVLIDIMGDKFVFLLLIMVAVYLVYSVIEIFYEPDRKIKLE